MSQGRSQEHAKSVKGSNIRKFEQPTKEATVLGKIGENPSSEKMLRRELGQIISVLKTYVYFPNRTHYLLVALWILGTYFIKDVEYYGYIYITSPLPVSGKSRVLKLINALAFQPSGVLIRPSEAVLFRTADGQTQLFDEVDTWPREIDVAGVLNAGFEHGGFVPRCEPQRNGAQKIVKFPVYGPKAFAGIAERRFSDTTKTRMFKIQMLPPLPTEECAEFEQADRDKLVEVPKVLESRIKPCKPAILMKYHEKIPVYLRDLGKRTRDILRPLSAILEVVFADSPEIEERRAELYEAASTTRQDGDETAKEFSILRTLIDLATAAPDERLIGNWTELCNRFPQTPDGSGSHGLKNFLERYQFEQKSVRFDDDKGGVRRRYVITLAQLKDLYARYGRGSERAPAVTG